MINNCRYCSYSHKIRECPAFGKVCDTCKKSNHFSAVCRFKKIDSIRTNNEVTSDYSDDNEEFYIGTVERVTGTNVTDDSNVYPWLETVVVENENVSFKIDTGAEIDVIPLKVLKQIGKRIKAKKTGTKLRAFGGQRIDPIGMCYLSCSFGNESLSARFAIVDLDITPILGLKSCIKFGIVKPTKKSSMQTCNRKQL